MTKKIIKPLLSTSISLAAIAATATLATSCSFTTFGDTSFLKYEPTIDPISQETDKNNQYWDTFGVNLDYQTTFDNYLKDVRKNNEIMINDIYAYYSASLQELLQRGTQIVFERCDLKITNFSISSSNKISMDISAELRILVDESIKPRSMNSLPNSSLQSSNLSVGWDLSAKIKYQNVDLIPLGWVDYEQNMFYLGINQTSKTDWSIDFDLSMFPAPNGVFGSIKQKFDYRNLSRIDLWSGINITINDGRPLTLVDSLKTTSELDNVSAIGQLQMIFMGGVWQSWYLALYTEVYDPIFGGSWEV